ncbi:MAG TPA: zinc-dependent peptidase [Gemmatimonadaceae bacterium]|nr:zinc-dependent peptidase [Gemmatimonadaceae bacterium]
MTAVGALIAGGVFIIAPLLRRVVTTEAARENAAPIAPDWNAVLDASVPAARQLTAAQRSRLLVLSRELLETRRWEGCGGFELDSEKRLVIAAQASLLTLATPGAPYPSLRAILVYPEGFVAGRVRDMRKWVPASDPETPSPELGESWNDGTVIIGWEASLSGAADPGDGTNLVIHEFAHQFAFDHHLIPLPISQSILTEGWFGVERPWERVPDVRDADAWLHTLREGYDRRVAKGDVPSVLDEYATTNYAEFFAVATEVFFERPAQLKNEDRALYGQLAALFRQDPASA